MENRSTAGSTFVLLGLAELEGLRYLNCVLLSITYLCILVLNIIIASVVLAERSLHEPMYVLICNLAFNGIFGSTSFYPVLLKDLWTSSKIISQGGCLAQSVCVTAYGHFEILTFTIMAYDRFLAVCHPLHYVNLMSNTKAIRLLMECLLVSFTIVLVAFALTMTLSFCGTEIKNIFCDNQGILVLACTNTSMNSTFGAVSTILMLSSTISFIVFSYGRIYIVCLRLSKESRQKAMHTLFTHLINFSVFLFGYLFLFIRYRMDSSILSVRFHVGLSLPTFLIPPLVNPLVFGVRTKALKSKIVYHLKRWMHMHSKLTHCTEQKNTME
ncbi:olfactory receptor 6X1-like [Hyperolius riggenbachi]|uniref:olfactory receptor 6X1-like n=1 Tax=Hyperolius riggenbachi TaxID=752182 RepID=UPI0035A3126D